MRKDLTEVVVVLDCSGSMAVCKSNIENGLNEFLETQKKLPGTARFTLVNFSDYYNIKTIVDGLDIKNVNSIKLEPSGNTALLDAIAVTVDRVGDRLSKTPEEERPALVLFAIVTDGYENNSRVYNREAVRTRLKHQTEKYNWQFQFIGANQDSILTATDYGLDASTALNFCTQSRNWSKGLIGNATRGRMSASAGQSYSTHYTEEEKLAAVA